MPNNPLGPRPGGTNSDLNVSGAPVVVKASPGTLYRISINTASAVSVSACYDATTVAVNNSHGLTAANHIADIPANATGIVELDWPCENGIAIKPGSGANLSISFQ